MKTYDKVVEQLGDKAFFYLDHVCEKIPKDELQLPDENFVSKVFVNSNRIPQTLRSLAQLYGHGNLKDTGYLSILPVDQGIEHSAAFSFYKNPDYFDLSLIHISEPTRRT